MFLIFLENDFSVRGSLSGPTCSASCFRQSGSWLVWACVSSLRTHWTHWAALEPQQLALVYISCNKLEYTLSMCNNTCPSIYLAFVTLLNDWRCGEWRDCTRTRRWVSVHGQDFCLFHVTRRSYSIGNTLISKGLIIRTLGSFHNPAVVDDDVNTVTILSYRPNPESTEWHFYETASLIIWTIRALKI